MYFTRILHFAVVSSIVYSTNSATIFSIDKKSNRLEIEISLTASNAKSNETWNIFGKIIAAPSDNVPDKCQCMLPHLCKSGDYSTEKGQCSTSSDVCCKLSLIPTTIPGGSLAITSESDQLLPSKFQTQQSPLSLHSGNVSQYECICVHSDQCADPLVTLAGAGQIDNTLERRFSCASPDICCPQESVVREVAEIPMPTSVSNPKPNSTSSFPTIQGECGIRNPSVGNRISVPELLAETSFGEFPWMALILTNETEPDGTLIENVFVCGASLLSSSIVLTAAHCVAFAKMSPDRLRIRVGEYNTHLAASEPMHHQDRSAYEIIVHPEFNQRVLFNDMALIRVTEEFTLASHISPVCIPIPFSPYADPSAYDSSNCLATGWGKDSSHEGNYQNTLRKVDLTVIEQNECQTRLRETKLGPKFNLHPSFMCAGGEVGFDTCEGDGGGPLVCASVDNPNRYIQVGVISWGIGCASNIPGVYASLYANREWLASEFNSSSELKMNNLSPSVPRSSTVSPLSTTSGLMETSSSIVSPSPKQQERKVRKRSVWNQTISLEGDVPETSIGGFPWMALILTTNTEPNGSMTENLIICEASLVSASVVLTAAHCIHNRNQQLLKVRVGEHNTRTPVSEPLNYQDRAVSWILSHDEFNDEFLYNDLALIQVSEDFHFTFQVSPIISLPLTIDPISYNPATCFAIGRGNKDTFDDRQQHQPILRKVDLSLVPRDECQDRLKQTTLGRQFELHSSFICAGGQINLDMCKGDGGGPLVCASRDNPNKYIQVGVKSRGIECGSDIPAVYESLEANRKWLTDQLNLLKAM